MKKFVALVATEGKTTMDECENGASDFLQALDSVHKKLGQFFFHNYPLIFLKKGTSVLLKVIFIYIGTS